MLCWAPSQRAMLDFFPQLLALAQLLLRHGKEPVRQAGAALYCCLFQHFTQHFNQQVRGPEDKGRWRQVAAPNMRSS